MYEGKIDECIRRKLDEVVYLVAWLVFYKSEILSRESPVTKMMTSSINLKPHYKKDLERKIWNQFG